MKKYPKNYYKITVYLILLFVMTQTAAFAATHYIRDGATGANNGSDWANAWISLPSTLVRGDTYYIADGTYPNYTFDDPVDGVNKIIILKAIEIDHGTDVGWNASYGDGQAIFKGISTKSTGVIDFITDHWVFDGQTGLKNGTEVAHGFKVTFSGNVNDIISGSHLVDIRSGADFINFYHTELDGLNQGQQNTFQPVTDAFYVVTVQGNDLDHSYINISHCYIHLVTRTGMLLNYVRNSVVENNYIKNINGGYNNPDRPDLYIHHEAIAVNYCGLNANNTFRYNVFFNTSGTGFLVIKDSVQSGFSIYGNVFYHTEDRYMVTNGAITNTTGDTNSGMYVYNNTFANINGNAGISWDNGNNNNTYNNIWFNCEHSPPFSNTLHDYNIFDDHDHGEQHAQVISQSPFVNTTNLDFHLKSSTLSGITLNSPYNADPDGTTRGSDGIWDRGAFEYNSAPSYSIASVIINPNSGYSKVGDTVTITATETNNTTGLTASPAIFNSEQVPLTDQGNGSYQGVYLVEEGDNDSVNVEANGIILTGTNGASPPASSSGSRLIIDAHVPAITTVTINPSSGTITTGDYVIITATATGNESGLTPSNAMINGKSIILTDRSNGTYKGVYTVEATDEPGVNIEATSITLTDDAGNVSASASSSGSTLAVNTNITIITSVSIDPNSGWVKAGDSVFITVTAENNESGLTPSNASINGKSIVLIDQGDGTYTGAYIVDVSDEQGVNIESTGITLTNGDGIASSPASSSGSTLKVDTHVPAISQVTINPNSGYVKSGDTIDIAAFSADNETGLIPSNASINGASVPLFDQGNGTYTGTYTVLSANNGELFAGDALFNDSFESGDTGNWTSASSDIVVGSEAKLGENGVEYDVQSTNFRSMIKELGAEYSETYTSFYFKLDSGFVMEDGSQNYLMKMFDNNSNTAWSFSLRRSGSDYQIVASRGGLLGDWVTLNNDQWYWIKIKYFSDVNGSTEWWVDGISQGSYNGDTSGSSSGKLGGIYLSMIDAGTTGKLYWDHFQVTTSDHNEPVEENLEASGITLTDPAGNTSESAHSTGSTLKIDTQAPVISSVIISPNSGTVGPADAVDITVTATDNESGLTASDALINGKSIPLTGQGNGTYMGTYIIDVSDNDGVNVEATGITLTDMAGNISDPASSSGSTLIVDTPDIPTISSVVITPNSGYIKVGDSVDIIVTAENNAAGHTPSNATFNSKQILLTDAGDGTYTGTYAVLEGDNDAVNAEATNITLTGEDGPSVPASSSGSTLVIDANTPSVESVTISPDNGFVYPGDNVDIMVTAGGNEAGLIPSGATLVNNPVSLTDNGNGTYTGTYTIQSSDSGELFAGDSIFNDSFESGNTDNWTTTNPEIVVGSEARYGANGIQYDIQSTNFRSMIKELGADYPETYTSFYFKLDSGFVMEDGNQNYLMKMIDNNNNTAWGFSLRRSGSDYQIIASGGGMPGDWVTLNSGQWYWIKIKYFSDVNGSVEWWIDGISQDSYNGNTSESSSGKLGGIYLSMIDAGTSGKLFWDHFQVTLTDHNKPSGGYIEATGITLTDAAGNEGAPASSSGSTLTIGEVTVESPVIESVVIDPNSGYAKIGDQVNITVIARDNETGLTPSDALINSKTVTLSDQGNGTYTGVYTIMEGDNDSSNVEATGITLTGEGGTSNPVSSAGSSLIIDANKPTVSSVTFNPDNGFVFPGDTIDIIVEAGENETGLIPSNANLLGNMIPLNDQGNGVYKGSHIINSNDNGEIFAYDSLFNDGFESGNTAKWEQANQEFIVNNSAKVGDKGIECDIQSVVSKVLLKEFGTNHPLTYSSFYFKIDSEFSMVGGDQHYIAMMRDINFNTTWSLSIRNYGSDYQIRAYSRSWLGEWFTLDRGQWYWIKIKHISDTNGSAEIWIDGVSRGAYAGDTSSAKSGKFYGVTLSGLDNGTKGKLYWDHFQVTTTDHSEPGDGYIKATGVTLADSAGNMSVSASLYSSTLSLGEVPVDVPVITSVVIAPSSGYVKVGDQVNITVTAGDNQTGLTPSGATINGTSVVLSDQGNGTYTGVYTVSEGDNDSSGAEASGITLTGEGGTSTPASSSGSTLIIDAHKPAISLVTIYPYLGTITTGDNVYITVTTTGNESGLIPSDALINGKSIPLIDKLDGRYKGLYTVKASDKPGVNIEATSITLTDTAGNVSAPASSSGSSLIVDTLPAGAPTVESVEIFPNSGYAKVGDSISIIVTAGGNVAGLTPSDATINGIQVSLSDQGNGTYTGFYVIQEGNDDASNVESTNITLTGPGGTSDPATSTGSSLVIDANTPTISQVTIEPNTGTVTVGDKVYIFVAAGGNEIGLTSSNAQFNGKSIPLTDQGNGIYKGTYSIGSGDYAGENVEALYITLSDIANNVSEYASSSGSTLSIDVPNSPPPPSPPPPPPPPPPPSHMKPVITSVVLTPDSGYIIVGNSVHVTVTAENEDVGLIPSEATINGKQIPLKNRGDGTYQGDYIVMDGDNDGINVEATDITLTGYYGTSEPASSTGSSLVVDANTPVITSVTITPDSGWVKEGETVEIIVRTSGDESGLIPSDTTINDVNVTLYDREDGTYTGIYTVQSSDTQSVNIETTNIILTDIAGNVSAADSSEGSLLNVDTIVPIISSVTLSPDTGTISIADEVVITVKAVNNETNLTASGIINGNSIAFLDNGSGYFEGIYTVQPDDNQCVNAEALNVTLTDAAGNVSNAVSTSGSSLIINTQDTKISSITIFPDSGYVSVGDTLVIEVTAEDHTTDLLTSDIEINDNHIPLINQGDGTYIAKYIVIEGDDDISGVTATNIILYEDGIAYPPLSCSAPSLIIDANTPIITSVILTPNSGTVSTSEEVTITVTEGNNESGLTTTDSLINGKWIPILDQGDGTYVGKYVVQEGDKEGVNIKAKKITLTDKAGNVSNRASSNISSIIVDSVSISVEHTILHSFSLSQNFPNPFNGSTTIEYHLPGNEGMTNAINVRIRIYNIFGQNVRELFNGTLFPGKHSIIWDGNDDIGREVGAGYYLYQIISGENKMSKKMIFMK